MTTWTLDQIRQARGFRSRTMVDSGTLERYGDDVRNEVASKMAKHITRDAHSFAIELHPDDFEVQWSDVEGEPWHVQADMRWHPTRPVELRGGHLDGQRYDNFERVGEPIRVPRPMPSAWETVDLGPGDAIPDLADTYELVGWREDERVWVYEARA